MTQPEWMIDGQKTDVMMKLYNTCTLRELKMIERLVRNIRQDQATEHASKVHPICQ